MNRSPQIPRRQPLHPAAAALVAALVAPLLTTVTGACIGSFTGSGAEPGAPAVSQDAMSMNLVQPWAVAASPSADAVYLTNSATSQVLVLKPDGTVAVYAGAGLGDAGDGDVATIALMTRPHALLVLPNGDLLVADDQAHRVRVVRLQDGVIAAFAGNGTDGWGGDGLPATASMLSAPSGLATGGDGAVVVTDVGLRRVLRIDAAGVVTTLAGTGAAPGWSGDGGPATAAVLLGPRGVAVLPGGAVVFADAQRNAVTGCALRIVMPDGVIDSLLGSSAAPPDYGGLLGVVATPEGDIFFSDFVRHAVWVRRPSGVVQLVAGVGISGYAGDGGPATAAAISAPGMLAIGGGFLFVAEFGGSMVRRVTLGAGRVTGAIARVAGGVPPRPGQRVSSRSVAIEDGRLAMGAEGLYVMTPPGYVQLINTSDWTMAPVVGNGLSSFGGDGGPATSASIQVESFPGLCNWNSGQIAARTNAPTMRDDLYIADYGNRRIRRVSGSARTIDTIAGNGDATTDAHFPSWPSAGLPATSFAIGLAPTLVLDAAGNVYFTYAAHELPPSLCDVYVTGAFPNLGALGIAVLNVSTGLAYNLACSTTRGYSGDGGPATAADCCTPAMGGVSTAGDVYFTELCSHTVRVVYASTHTIATLAGNGAPGFSGDGGPAAAAQLNFPLYLRIAQSSTVYFVDVFNGRIRAILPDGTITTVAGNGDISNAATGDGGDASAASLGGPSSLEVDAAGNVVFAPNEAGQLRAVVVGDRISCPIGHACPCAAPVPCPDAGAFCPGGTLAPSPVSTGFYTTPEPPPGPGGAIALRSGQSPCPVGSFCVNGSRAACFPGTFGSSRFAASPRVCTPCPAGTFSADAGAAGGDTCVACPPGSFANATGSAWCALCPAGTAGGAAGATSAAAACSPCAAGTSSLPGATACFPTASVVLSTTDALVSFETAGADDGPEAPAGAARDLQVLVGVLVLLAAVVPLAAVLAAAACPAAFVTHPRLGRVVDCCDAVRWSLRRVDMFSLRHVVREGASPTKLSTSCGGAASVVAVAVMVAVGSALLIQFSLHNELVQSSVLPLSLGTAAQAGGVPLSAVAAEPDGLPPPLGIAAGVTVQLRLTGAACAVANWSNTSVAGGGFALQTATNATTRESVHTFACADCVFTSLSELAVAFPPACQHVSVRAASVTTTGAVVVVAFEGSGPAVRASAADPLLSELTAVVAPMLELFSDATAGMTTRGHRITVESVAPAYDGSGALSAVVVRVRLPLSPFYVSVTVVPLESVPQLLSSLIGLLGLVGLFAAVYAALENAALTASERLRKNGGGRRGGGAAGGSGGGGGDGAPACLRRLFPPTASAWEVAAGPDDGSVHLGMTGPTRSLQAPLPLHSVRLPAGGAAGGPSVNPLVASLHRPGGSGGGAGASADTWAAVTGIASAASAEDGSASFLAGAAGGTPVASSTVPLLLRPGAADGDAGAGAARFAVSDPAAAGGRSASGSDAADGDSGALVGALVAELRVLRTRVADLEGRLGAGAAPPSGLLPAPPRSPPASPTSQQRLPARPESLVVAYVGRAAAAAASPHATAHDVESERATAFPPTPPARAPPNRSGHNAGWK